MAHKVEIEGVETEVYTLDEVTARETAAREAVSGEFMPKISQAEKDLAEARTALAARAGEFATFRKLSDEQVAALSEKDRIIYENGVVIAEQQQKIEGAAKTAHDNAVAAAIRARVGGNEDLYKKATEMYALINLNDATPEGLTARVAATFGAIGGTQPDLLASAGFAGGGFAPPVEINKGTSVADTDEGKAFAKEFGLVTEEPKQQ